MRKVPGYGKAIGIIMIVLGALGFFYQIYKLMASTIVNIQKEVFDNISSSELNDSPFNDRAFSSMSKMMDITPFQSQVLTVFGAVGILICGLYIAAGIKLLKIGPQNYKFGKFTLLSTLIFNFIGVILLLNGSFSMIVIGIVVYAVIGFIFDLVLWIILISSDKTKYDLVEDNQEVLSNTGAYKQDTDNYDEVL